MHEGKARWEIHINAMCYFEQSLEATLHKTATTLQLLAFHFTNHPSKTNKAGGTSGEEQTQKQHSYGLLNMVMPQCWLTSKDFL